MVIFQRIIFIVFVVCISFNANSQNSFNADAMFKHEQKLMVIGDSMINSHSSLTRQQASRDYIKAFRAALVEKGSYQYSFDSLKFMSRLAAPDNAFKLFTWILKLPNNRYKYFGVIQVNNPDSLEIHPLFDRSQDFEPGSPEEELNSLEREFSITNNEDWNGAYYYDLGMVEKKKFLSKKSEKYYVLLGWDGNNGVSHKKVVDILTIDNGLPTFGQPIIKTQNGMQTRLVLECNSNAVITLKYHDEEELITFDLLVPKSDNNQGKYFTYIPSGQYDYLEWKRNKFYYRS
ncbi:MAG: hypothetical protein KDC92_12835, partial [Bacteroidetes bacterium]|nr:hypothetical protein [Bacteroidota bacterium]